MRGLRKRYGALEAAKDVSFEIREGETCGLLGPSGAGEHDGGTTSVAPNLAVVAVWAGAVLALASWRDREAITGRAAGVPTKRNNRNESAPAGRAYIAGV